MNNKETLQKNIEDKTKELDDLKSKILIESENLKKQEFEEQQKKLEEELVILQEQLNKLEELEKITANNQTNKETNILKETIEVDNDWSYEIIKWSKMYDKLLTILWSESKVEIFALEIDAVVRKYLDQELIWFSNSIKNSMSVGIQFAMMETLIKQWAQWSTQFFDAFTSVKSKSSSKAFEWLYKAFGTLWSANEFYVLANKVQNITRYLSDKKNIIDQSDNIVELINPNQFKLLLHNPVWSNQAQINKLDITTLLTLHSTTPVDIHADDEELKKIVNNDALLGVITEKTIPAIQKSLKTADKLLDSRGKFKTKTSDLIDTIAWFLDIDIPFLWNLGEMIWMEFPTDILWEKKDWWILNFVLGVLGFRGGVQWLHREYIREKLDELHIDNAFISAAYTNFQKNIDTTITHDSATSTWKICALTASDPTMELTMKAKIPADYLGLKTSIIDTIDTATLNPTMVAKFAPEIIITENNLPVIDMTKIKDNKDDFVDRYLKYIIPLLSDPSDDFITSSKIDKDSFVLATIWGLLGDKYFIEGVNIGILLPTTFLSSLLPVSVENTTIEWKLDVINGKIDFSKGNFSPEQIKNINFLIDEMNNKQIIDPNTQIGILSVIGKESGFVPKNEISYENTPNQDIRKIFWDRVAVSDTELTELKKNQEVFFNKVYATTTGNEWWNDGRKYRGRGYNQLTGKDNYKHYGELTGTDILNNPDSLNDPIVASKIALAFFTQWKEYSSFPQFTTKDAAAIYFADINAGGHPGGHRADALHVTEKFDIQTTIA